MKIKNKGKVYPSPSPESDALSVFKLLPAAILALASLLSPEDREVLAYLITRSLKTTTTNNPSDSRKKSSKKPPPSGAAAKTHKPPIFECECFDCYTSYWFRWDSSPNRELINQAIEAFEDHLAHGEKSKKTKRRDKTNHRNNLPLPPQQDFPARSDDEVGKRVEPEEAVGEPPVVVAAAEIGVARKVLPEVLGLFNSRLWSLWGPNV